MAEQPDIPADLRAQLDRQHAEAVDGLLAQAAGRDHLDVIEANHDLACWLSERMTPHQLAVATAALAIRLRRFGGESS